MSSYRSVCDHKHVACFQLQSNTFHYFEINHFLKTISHFCLTFQLLCSFLSNCYRALLWSGPIFFPVKYKLFCLVFTPPNYSRWRRSFCSLTILKKILEVLGVFYVPHLDSSSLTFMPKMRMSGAGTSSANAHYQASLLIYVFV